jgi:hypothetical protein
MFKLLGYVIREKLRSFIGWCLGFTFYVVIVDLTDSLEGPSSPRRAVQRAEVSFIDRKTGILQTYHHFGRYHTATERGSIGTRHIGHVPQTGKFALLRLLITVA